MGMNPEVRTEWTADLRSGNYTQGHGYLITIRQDDDGNEIRKHCCLGVLCEQAVRKGIIDPAEYESWNNSWEFDGNHLTLPYRVVNWAGLRTDNPAIAPRKAKGGRGGSEAPEINSLAEANDGGYSFVEIANIIEKEL